MERRLGLIKRPVPPGAPTLAGHGFGAVQAPPRLDRSHVAYAPQLQGNGVCGDCTWAAVGNAILAQAALLRYRANVPDTAAVTMYQRQAGYDPANPATDTGANEVDVLTWQAQHGFDASQEAPYVGLWANLARDDWNAQRLAASRFGVCYYAIDLALADQSPGTWDITTPGDQTPGGWGGHAVVGCWSYTGIEDTDLVTIITWGAPQLATWRWMRSRVVEAHVLVHPQICGTDRFTGAGIDRDRLAADVAGFAVA